MGWTAGDRARVQAIATWDVTVARIEADPDVVSRLAGLDVAAVAASLTWLGERLYYLSAIGSAPFDDQHVLIDTLLHLWTAALYGL